MMVSLPIWVETIVAGLLLASGVLSLIAAFGLLRLKDFFQRMHAPATMSTLGTWCVVLASMVYFSVLQQRPVLHGLLIVILMAITAPVSTTLLARAAVFRQRLAGLADRNGLEKNAALATTTATVPVSLHQDAAQHGNRPAAP